MDQQSVRVGVDIGGTFTDVAVSRGGALSTCKVLTNYAAPEQAILDAIELAVKETGLKLSDIDQVIHGTTLVTNSLIQRRGAKIAFVTTQGFRDVIEMRSENRFEQYDLNLVLPQPLVPRADRLTLNERIGPDGQILQPLDPAEVDAVVKRILECGYEAVAIGLMHSYACDAHELAMAEALRKAAPDLSISISSLISPQMRELPRFNTVIANAYVQPQVAQYLGSLRERLCDADVEAPLLMMHSGGGLIALETAIEQPVRLLESGPAGGAIFAAEFARIYSLEKVLSFDMGGTTAKICLVEGGAPKTANVFEVARSYRFKKGSGMIVSTPVVEMVEIGAGGGSIASIDTMGRLQVGPESAGSEPGPACYGRGGTEPTVSDANLVLGRLDSEQFAGGAIKLLSDASKKAIEEKICATTDLDVTEASYGITEMVDESMANAVRVHAVENGRDVESFTMIGFGGGAPMHACRLCEKLGMNNLLIPPSAGVGSAIGFLKAPFSYEVIRGHFQRLDAFRASSVNRLLKELKAEALTFVKKGAGKVATRTKLTAFMRYTGQGYEIPVVLQQKSFSDKDIDEIQDAFDTAYTKLFGRTIEGLAVEITNWSLVVETALKNSEFVEHRLNGPAPNPAGRRNFYDAEKRAMVSAQEVMRSEMSAGKTINGPAVIVENETTTIVTSAFRAVGQEDGSLLLTRKEVSK